MIQGNIHHTCKWIQIFFSLGGGGGMNHAGALRWSRRVSQNYFAAFFILLAFLSPSSPSPQLSCPVRDILGRRRRCSSRRQRKGQPEQGRHHLDQEEDEFRAQTLLVRGVWPLPCSCRCCQSFFAVENAPVKQSADILASHPILWASTAAPPEP